MKLAETCVKYPVFTVMLIAFLVTLGVFSYRGLAVDLFPKADPATVNVNVRLPRDTLPPIITKEDPQSDPIMTLLVSGPMSRRELTEIADKQVRRLIQTVDGVGSVDLNGGQSRQVRVLLDAQKLTAHNFTVLDVRDALRRENIEAPGGRMITGPQELVLLTLGRVGRRD